MKKERVVFKTWGITPVHDLPCQANLVPRARFTFGQHQVRDLWPGRIFSPEF